MTTNGVGYKNKDTAYCFEVTIHNNITVSLAQLLIFRLYGVEKWLFVNYILFLSNLCVYRNKANAAKLKEHF